MPAILNEDKVWFDEARKLEHICADVATSQSNGHSVVLLSHFESTLASLAAALREKGISYERFSSLNPAALCMPAPGKVWFDWPASFK
jgi:hypothetical protein